ncbi:MAG: LamB/YcsF family protein, partial [Verrucomicrobiaceae bacterium]
ALAKEAEKAGLTVCTEGFADRRYRDDGSLMPRGEPGAVIKDVESAVAQAMEIVSSGRMETLCVHGDGTTATAILSALRGRLDEAGLAVRRKLRNGSE